MDGWTRSPLMLSVALLMLAQGGWCQGITQCVFNTTSTCSCRTNLGIIDLRPLTKNTPYKVAGTHPQVTYYWEPCKDFTFSGTTAGVIQESAGNIYDLGIHQYGASDVVSGGYARFSWTSGDQERVSFFTCKCDRSTDSSVVFDWEQPVKQYHFTVSSKHCCSHGEPPSTTPAIDMDEEAVDTVNLVVIVMLVIILILAMVSGTAILVRPLKKNTPYTKL